MCHSPQIYGVQPENTGGVFNSSLYTSIQYCTLSLMESAQSHTLFKWQIFVESRWGWFQSSPQLFVRLDFYNLSLWMDLTDVDNYSSLWVLILPYSLLIELDPVELSANSSMLHHFNSAESVYKSIYSWLQGFEAKVPTNIMGVPTIRCENNCEMRLKVNNNRSLEAILTCF